jgi:hypothetical protein
MPAWRRTAAIAIISSGHKKRKKTQKTIDAIASASTYAASNHQLFSLFMFVAATSMPQSLSM